MKFIPAILAVVALTGCASARMASNPAYLTGAWDGKTSAATIESNLTRGSGMGSPKSSAYLYTRPLIEAQAHEAGRNRMMTPEDIQKTIQAQVAELAGNQTCFMVTIESSIIDFAMFKNYTAKVFVGEKAYPVTFAATNGVQSVPRANAYGGFINNSVGCTKERVDVSQTFAFKMADDTQKVEMVWERESDSARTPASYMNRH